MPKIDIQQVLAWATEADAIFQTPLVRLTILPMLKAMLPPMGITPEQIAILDAHYDDLVAREADARRRATRLD